MRKVKRSVMEMRLGKCLVFGIYDASNQPLLGNIHELGKNH